MIQSLATGILGVIGYFCCYCRHGRRVNSLCQITERLLFFQDKHRTTQAFVGPSHFWSHTSLVKSAVYSNASAHRTAPRFGELRRSSSRWTQLLTLFGKECLTKRRRPISDVAFYTVCHSSSTFRDINS